MRHLLKNKWIIMAFFLSVGGKAVAQSNITTHGILDVCIDSLNTGSSSIVIQQSACQAQSRVRITGKDPLDESLHVIYTLEAGLNINEGSLSQGGRIFGRQAWVGLQGDLGTFTLGRQYTPQDDFGEEIADAFSGGYNGSFLFLQGEMKGQLSAVTIGSQLNSNSLVDWSQGQGTFSINQPYGLRVDNSIKYVTPTRNGFSSSVMYSFGEVVDSRTDGRQLGITGRYTDGSMHLGMGYHQIVGTRGTVVFNPDDTATFTPTTGNFTQRTMGAAVSYDWSVFRLYTNFERTWFEMFSASDFGVSGLYHLTEKLELIAGTVQKTISPFDDLNASQYSVALKYSKTKSTSFYASYSQIKNAGNDQQGASYIPSYAVRPIAGTSPDSFMIGMRHDLK